MRVLDKVLIILVLGGIAAALALVSGCQKYDELRAEYPDDNVIEEMVESIGEREAEIKLGLPAGSLKGRLDITPSTKEK